jgi:EipB-like
MNQLRISSACLLIIAGLSPVQAATLAPHRAFYDLQIKRLDKGNNISSIVGKLAYEIRGSSCEGFAVNYRIANRIVYQEGGTQVIDTQLSSFETGDGLELDLTQKQFVDAKLNSDSRIKVKKSSAEKPGKGMITKTDTKEFEIAPTAIFPTQYQLKLIDSATRGEARDSSLVYEGSEDDKALKAIGFIGAKRAIVGVPDKEAKKLGGMDAWPVSISYYSAESGFLMLANGISSELELDYGSYALSGKLSTLELLEADSCN